VETSVEISICIPAYKNVEFLERLLHSISIQSFADYEVVITDDSPDDSVKKFIQDYTFPKPIRYIKNTFSLGTPENWNEAIRNAKGKWIKLMHNDDWYVHKDALKYFYDASLKHSRCSFFFSAFQNINYETGDKEVVKCNLFDRFILWLSPLHLFRKVYVGNPSCTLIRRDAGLFYDNRFKYVVDFEYYIRCIKKLNRYQYIDEVLLNIGFHKEQVTKYTFLVPSVQIPENLILLDKLGHNILRNLLVYDYYWRMVRNLKIRNPTEIKTYYDKDLNRVIKRMINFQSKVPVQVLQIGLFSKSFMLLNYVFSLMKTH